MEKLGRRLKEAEKALETLEEIQREPYSAEGGYDARALGYSIYTEEESIEGLKKAIVDAVKCHFEEKETYIVKICF